MNRQDGPLLVGALNENTNVSKPLLVNNDGELLVTSTGGGGTSDVNLVEVGGAPIALGQDVMADSLPVVIASNQSAIPVVGNIAHDFADSGNPVKVGNKAVAFGANPSAVAAGDRTDAYANVAGLPFFLNTHPNAITRRDNYTSAQTDTAILTVSAGTKIVVLSIQAVLDEATSVAVAVRIGFGATTTPTGEGVYLSHPGIKASTGNGVTRAGAIPGGDGIDLRITCEAPTGGSLDVLTSYFTIPE